MADPTEEAEVRTEPQGSPVLPERVRAQVIAYVADALPEVTPLPASLRKVAQFAPARRAKLGRQAIWTALAADDFRDRAATQVAARHHNDGDRPDGTDELVEPLGPVEIAARAWLLRPEGWEDQLAGALGHLGELTRDEVDPEELDRLRGLIEAERAKTRGLQERHREALSEARAETTTLRQRLGEARAALRDAEASAAAAQVELEDVRTQARESANRTEAELRRLRAQVAEAESGRAADRRGSRDEREAATIRARYLLDTVVNAAQGLQRELGLPPATESPSARLEARLEGEVAESTTSAPMTAAVLEQILSMPKSRLIIDGYNVTKQAWPTATLEAQRSRLTAALGAVVARTGVQTAVVFDAAAVTAARPVIPAPRGVRVLYSPPGVIADDTIRDLVACEPVGRVVVAVTSDQELAGDLRRAGARVVDSAVLVELLG